jgi:hypothetical protein
MADWLSSFTVVPSKPKPGLAPLQALAPSPLMPMVIGIGGTGEDSYDWISCRWRLFSMLWAAMASGAARPMVP